MSLPTQSAAFSPSPSPFLPDAMTAARFRRQTSRPVRQPSPPCIRSAVERTASPAERAAAVQPGLKSSAEITQNLLQCGMLDPADTQLLAMLSDSRAAHFEKVLTNRTRHITFVLDGVYGAHNLAAIARSCDAWGIQDLHVIEQPADYVTKRHFVGEGEEAKKISILERFRTESGVQNVSKNCHKWLSIAEYSEPGPCIEKLRKGGYKVIVSSLAKEAQSIHEVDVSGKCAFVFGNERHGVTKEIEAQADAFFTIPMMGFVESMNVSVAVGTTACLTSTKCKQLLSSSKYLVPPEQMRELAHLWLIDRFSVKQAPKKMRSRRDVTKLGHNIEDRIVKRGIFASVEDQSLTGAEFWGLALRPAGDGGRRLVTDFTRRKVGILGEIGIVKLRLATNLTIAGSHALSCEAALWRDGSSAISRTRLYKYFELACEEVHAAYRPHFDQFGVPSQPAYSEEATAVFSTLENTAPNISAALLEMVASELFGIGAGEAYDFISGAGVADIARSVAETLRCDEGKSAELQVFAASASERWQEMKSLETGEVPNVRMSVENVQLGRNNHPSRTHKDLLHVYLRLCNAAQLCSEIYQTIWDRHKNSKLSRIRTPRFGILESLLSDSYSERIMGKASFEAALCCAMLEWYQVLQRLQQHTSGLNR